MWHTKGTGAEIYAQCGGKVDMVVAGAGTGGTIAGIGRKLKPLLPNIKVSIELPAWCCLDVLSLVCAC